MMPDLDASEWIYLTGATISLYGAVLFAWWWIKNKNASFIFACVTVLFAGEFIDHASTLYGRMVRIGAGDPVWWPIRGALSILAAFVVVAYLTLRVAGCVNLPLHTRRKEDKSPECLCRTGTGVIVHEIGGPLLYYKCAKCGQEWHKGDEGYDRVKSQANGVLQ